jgi:hypothetical protein
MGAGDVKFAGMPSDSGSAWQALAPSGSLASLLAGVHSLLWLALRRWPLFRGSRASCCRARGPTGNGRRSAPGSLHSLCGLSRPGHRGVDGLGATELADHPLAPQALHSTSPDCLPHPLPAAHDQPHQNHRSHPGAPCHRAGRLRLDVEPPGAPAQAATPPRCTAQPRLAQAATYPSGGGGQALPAGQAIPADALRVEQLTINPAGAFQDAASPPAACPCSIWAKARH